MRRRYCKKYRQPRKPQNRSAAKWLQSYFDCWFFRPSLSKLLNKKNKTSAVIAATSAADHFNHEKENETEKEKRTDHVPRNLRGREKLKAPGHGIRGERGRCHDEDGAGRAPVDSRHASSGRTDAGRYWSAAGSRPEEVVSKKIAL